MYKSPIVLPVEGIDRLSPSCRRSGCPDRVVVRGGVRVGGRHRGAIAIHADRVRIDATLVRQSALVFKDEAHELRLLVI